jgi:hypothetical protein
MPSIAQLLPLLGKDYERKCIEPGIIKRVREIKTPADLMMLCLFHVLNGVFLFRGGGCRVDPIVNKFPYRICSPQEVHCRQYSRVRPENREFR